MTRQLAHRIFSVLAVLFWGLSTALSGGCGNGDYPTNIVFGRVLPYFAVRVEFVEPQEKEILFRELHSFASANGFSQYRGAPISSALFTSGSAISTFDWFPPPDSSISYRMGASWFPRNAESPTSVVLHFYNNSMDDFTQVEWQIYEHWINESIPNAFPGAIVTTEIHPRKYTSSDVILELEP